MEIDYDYIEYRKEGLPLPDRQGVVHPARLI